MRVPVIPRETTVLLDRGSVRRIVVVRETEKTTLVIHDWDDEDKEPLIEAVLSDAEREDLIQALCDPEVAP